ncbi:hypothetical protein N7449_001327 [Penicillium cf. viridicatum]|uniref:Uncharacterized protein n=1 Tax=Penicillium cf. viridicatum TaxID=2972119 RepID=A0A9W9T955_9EURO|nr:hypothetical protein N7449_001327 [Penicillium cf. viridicatum]
MARDKPESRMDNARQGKMLVIMLLPAPARLLVSQDNHEIFLTITSYEPEYVECFKCQLFEPSSCDYQQSHYSLQATSQQLVRTSKANSGKHDPDSDEGCWWTSGL